MMVTSLCSLTQVYGADIWVAFTLACGVVYLAACCLLRRNRTKKGFCAVLLALLAAEFLCDTAWAALFYPGGVYHDYGLGGSYLRLLLWPALLVLAGGLATAWNRKD